MGRYNFAPQRVHQAVTRLLEHKRVAAPPPWYDVVANLPPSERLVRPALQGARKKGKKASRLFQPVKIEYPEDKLRFEFFGDHPWELARPRQVLEDDGKDYQRYDWSRLEQPGKQLDGESVVQRQIWLMGLMRHDMDLTTSRQMRDWLRSPVFQEELQAFIKAEFNVDVECAVPAREKDTEAALPLSLRLLYHPEQQHDFPAALKHLTNALANQGLDPVTINQRTFTVALKSTDDLASSLPTITADLRHTHGINLTLNAPLTIRPSPTASPQTYSSLTLTYHRDAIPSLPQALSHLTTTLHTTLIHAPLPPPSPSTTPLHTKSTAYDTARREFYVLRHNEEIQRRVAREEALHLGASFGPSALEVGMHLENTKYDEWRVWAAKEIQTQRQLSSAGYTGLENGEAEVGAEEVVGEAGREVLGVEADAVPALGGAEVHP